MKVHLLVPGGHCPNHSTHEKLQRSPRKSLISGKGSQFTPGGQSPVHGATGHSIQKDQCRGVIVPSTTSIKSDRGVKVPTMVPYSPPRWPTLAGGRTWRPRYPAQYTTSVGQRRAPFKGTQGPTGSATRDRLYPSHKLLQGEVATDKFDQVLW